MIATSRRRRCWNCGSQERQADGTCAACFDPDPKHRPERETPKRKDAMKAKPLTDPFADLLPPLSTEEFEALKADIAAHGVLYPIFVDEDGNVLDGRHRLKIDPTAPRKVIKGLTPAEKEAFVFRANFVRRNLSPAQKDEARRKMKETAKRLREEDKRKWTQKRVAQALGVERSTVAKWFPATTDVTVHNSCKASPAKPQPDARVKVNPQIKPLIAAAVRNGKPEAHVAADLGVSQQAISRIVREQAKLEQLRQVREEAARKREGNCGVIQGDFRVFAAGLDDASLDMIFTDPPYAEAALDLYRDLGIFAAAKLAPGGWVLAYSGKRHLPQAMQAMAAEGLVYGWTFCVIHKGGDARFRNLKIQTGWKPVIGYYKPPLAVGWDWFADTTSGGKEKAEHPWQQAVDEAAHFIKALCPKGGLVCDPFAGSGTSLLAAKRLGMKWIGCEKDPETAETARSRLDDATV